MEKFGCEIFTAHVFHDDKIVLFITPKCHRPNMQGAIDLAKFLLKNVGKIYVLPVNEPYDNAGTVYEKIGGKWKVFETMGLTQERSKDSLIGNKCMDK